MYHEIFGCLILGLAALGVVDNVAGIALLSIRQWRSRRDGSGGASFGVFHQLLRMLSAFDLVVVVCSALSYGLPNVWRGYTAAALPATSPYLTPVVHIALMASVYCTVFISLERYIRICFLCQLRELGAFTEKNAWMYKLGIVLFSVLFYIPKFFEVRWESTDVSFNTTHMCAEVIMRSLGGGGGGGGGENSTVLTTFFRFFAPPSPTNGTTTTEEGDSTEVVENDIEALLVIDLDAGEEDWVEDAMVDSCLRQAAITGDWSSARVVLRRTRRILDLVPTALRRSPLYYRYYCVLANFLLASALPLAALVYLNISTVRVLRRMASAEEDSSERIGLSAASANTEEEGSRNVGRKRGNFNNRRRMTAASLISLGVRRCSKSATRNFRNIKAEAPAAAATQSSYSPPLPNVILTSSPPPPRSKQSAGDGDGDGDGDGGENTSSSSPSRGKVPRAEEGGEKVECEGEGTVVAAAKERSGEYFRREEDEDGTNLNGASLSNAGNSPPATTREGQGGAVSSEAEECKGGGLMKERKEDRETRLRSYGRVSQDAKQTQNNDPTAFADTPSGSEATTAVLSAVENGAAGRDSSSSALNKVVEEEEAEGEAKAFLVEALQETGISRTGSGDGGGGREAINNNNGSGRGDDDAERQEDRQGIKSRFGAARVNSLAAPPPPSVRAPLPLVACGGAGHQDPSTRLHHARERRLARISISIVWLFVGCHMWRAVPTVYESWHSADGLSVPDWPTWLVVVEHLSHTLITLNSAVNFLIYVLK